MTRIFRGERQLLIYLLPATCYEQGQQLCPMSKSPGFSFYTVDRSMPPSQRETRRKETTPFDISTWLAGSQCSIPKARLHCSEKKKRTPGTLSPPIPTRRCKSLEPHKPQTQCSHGKKKNKKLQGAAQGRQVAILVKGMDRVQYLGRRRPLSNPSILVHAATE